jgi:hypothetical protein
MYKFEIRAVYDEETITVYQAYNAAIADAAVKHQKLNASPLFKSGRMTWIKPSWCWMMCVVLFTLSNSFASCFFSPFLRVTYEFFLLTHL